MLARVIAVAMVAASFLAAAPARGQQGYAPGRPSFTLGERLQQWGRGLLGEPAESDGSFEAPATTSPTKAAARSSGPRMTNHPNYHRPADTSNQTGSSRRTAQPTYQRSASTPVADDQAVEPIPATPKPSRPAVDRGYTASKVTPPKAAPSVQPRTLQEALFNPRPTPEKTAEDMPPPSSKPKAVAAMTPTPMPTPAKTPRPATESPARTARRSEPRVPAGESGPSLEEPLPVTPSVPVAEKEKPSASSRSTDGLLFTHKSPVLAVEAKGPRRTAVGRETKFRISLRNTGDVSARDVLLVVQVPAGTEVVSAHPTVGEARLPAGQDAAPVLRWSVSEVPSRSQEELELLLVPRKSEAIDLVVQWTFAPDTQQIVVDVQEPKLQMHLDGPKEVAFGEKAIYKLTFANPGDADAENVMVTLPAIGEGDGPADSHTIGTIRAGESKVVEMELVARQMGRLTIKAEATADSGLHTTVSEDVIVRRAGIKVELEGPTTGYARTNVNYKVIVSNNGNAAAADVQVAVQLPPRAKYLSSSEGGESSGERVVWTLDSLEPGQQQVLQLKCQLENPGANRLQAAAIYGDLKDLATLNTDVEAVADLTLSVEEPAGVSAVGEDVTYEVRIKNRGTTAATGVNVVAFFSEGVEAVSATGARYEITPGKIQFGVIPSIAADKELVLKIKARADRAGNHVFRAEAQCTALGSKLAQEGTTRFIGNDAAEKETVEPEAATPKRSTSTTSSADRSSTWSGSSRRRGSVPSDVYSPDAGNGESR